MAMFDLTKEDKDEIAAIYGGDIKDLPAESIEEVEKLAKNLLAKIEEYKKFIEDGGAGDNDRCQFGRKRIRLALNEIYKIAVKMAKRDNV